MTVVTHFTPALAEGLPKTHALLVDAGLCVHRAVERVTLHGSRGPKGGARPDSDIDLCLIVNDRALAAAADRKVLLRDILSTTLNGWRGRVELDLAAVFDKRECGLRCLVADGFDLRLCPTTVGCMGLFKTQKGFNGFVDGPAVDCSRMYPLMELWRRRGHITQ